MHQLTEVDFSYDVILSRWQPWRSATHYCIFWLPTERITAVPDPVYICTCC